MNDSISRQAAIDKAERECKQDGAYGYMDIKSIIDMLEDLPSTDAVEIVRCKNCIHFEDGKDYVMFCKHIDGLDSIKPESFCSYGEKKDAEIL